MTLEQEPLENKLDKTEETPAETVETVETVDEDSSADTGITDETAEEEASAEVSAIVPAEADGGASDEEQIIRLPVKVDSFTGPLDLLVHLITKDEVDICSFSLASITNEYLKTIRSWQVEDLDIAGEYLVLAATLIRLKARALLPKEERETVEEVLSDDVLEQRRREYARFRHLAEELRFREEKSSNLFPRVGHSPEGPKEVFEYTEVSIYDLYHTFQKIIEEIGTNMPNHVLKGETYSVDEKMLEIEALITHNQRLVLTDYLRRLESKLEMIVVFMALLELIRLKEVVAQQDRNHGEIVLVKGEKPIPTADGETESEDEYEE